MDFTQASRSGTIATVGPMDTDCRFPGGVLHRLHRGPAGVRRQPTAGLDDFFKKMLDELYDGVYFVDPDRRILYWNRAAERLSGYMAAEVVGKSCLDDILQHRDSEDRRLCRDRCPVVESMELRKPVCKRVFLRHKEGYRLAVEVRVSPVMDERGRILGAVEIFRDAGGDLALESAYRSARELARKDPLTGLANRRFLSSFLAEQLLLYSRSGRRFSLIMIDIDHFKSVNDRFGHQVGDQALAEVARVLLRSSRGMDLAARYGGEEFAIVLPCTPLEHAAVIAERIRAQIEGLNWAEEIGLPALTASLGIAESAHGEDSDALIARADAALYEAKLRGRNHIHVSSHSES